MHLNVSKLQKPPLVVQSCKRIAAVEGVTFNLKPCQVLEHDSRAFLPKLVLSYEQISCIFAWCLEIHIYIYILFGLLAKAMHPLVKRIAARFFNLLEKKLLNCCCMDIDARCHGQSSPRYKYTNTKYK